MNKLNEKYENTDLYARIRHAPMSEHEREIALGALHNADAIVDATLWVVNGVKRVIARILEKPAGLKHSH